MGIIKTKYFADKDTGKFLGSFSGIEKEVIIRKGKRRKKHKEFFKPKYPKNAIEVPTSAADIRDVWDGSKWVAYDNSAENALAFLRNSDAKLGRAVEDIIAVLTKKNIISDSDLPDAVMKMIKSRKAARSQL